MSVECNISLFIVTFRGQKMTNDFLLNKNSKISLKLSYSAENFGSQQVKPHNSCDNIRILL